MHKMARRWIAGISVAALFVSAVGTDVFTNVFMRTVPVDAASSNRRGKSTGFSDLEQDTDKDGNYNTGYGLHTNKTASVAAGSTDGRTFDVNLESWYVGENPVDVATILDASGSMAWTVDTLDPLEVKVNSEAIKAAGYPNINTIDDLIKLQEGTGDYLPQSVVDTILDPKNTDNSKLGYDKYKYYVYEDRSSVSEFVPLGYWDGGADPKTNPSLIGYYPFSGDLKNKAPGGGEGKLINHPESGESSYNTNDWAKETLKAKFVTKTEVILDSKGKPTGKTEEVVKGLNIADSSSKGAILVASPTTNKFSISFKMSVDNSDSNFDQATILYLTDGTNDYRIYRDGSKSASRLKATVNDSNILNAKEAVNTKPRQWTFTFDFTAKTLKIDTDTDNVLLDSQNKLKSYTVDLTSKPALDVGKLKIYIGGNTIEYKNPNDIYIRNLTINDFNGSEEIPVANYPLETKENGLKNTVDAEKPPIFVEQAYNNGGKFGEEEIGTHLLDPVFKSDDKALDVKATSQNGAVLLDAVPKLDDGFTISMKLYRTGSLNSTGNQQNIFYLGDKNTKNQYYQYFRSKNAGGYLGISESEQKDLSKPPAGTDMVYYQGGMASGTSTNEVWYTNTLVFKTDPANPDKYIVTPYINGEAKYQDGSVHNFSIDKISVSESDLVFLLCALKKNGSGSDQYLDDLYVFNNALTETQVAQYFGESFHCDAGDTLTHAQSVIDGEIVDIAQISNGEKRLGKNTNVDQRRGWYYVNSHSKWEDVEGCLASGKQYIGIKKEDKGETNYSHKDKVTIPSGMDQKLIEDIVENYENNSSYAKHADYAAPSTERSIRFYVDPQKHLRCFVWSGDDSTEDEARTFCSLVYEKKDNQETKYEELNGALNTFYQNLAEYSDLSNSAVVRFSTINAVDPKTSSITNANLKKLIMKDWTNWSDAVLKEKQEDKTKYLNDLLIPEDGESSMSTKDSTVRDEIEEYPYVMTGGTYTWTGLKSFYDNMVKTDELSSGDRVYDVANDARDKYLIIFTDGRDNTVGSSDTKFCEKYSPKGHEVSKDADLAKAWTDKLKDEGYTIYCVMMATGSISPDANEEEYNKAKNFLETLAGTYNAEELKADYQKRLDEENAKYNGGGEKPDDKLIIELKEKLEELKKDPENHIIVVNPALGDESTTVKDAFQQILEDIQQPREDYTVQDYIDPRFDLVDGDGNLYQLGADGKITIKNPAGGESTYTVGDVIDNPYATGCSYKPIASEMVNRTLVHDSKGNYDYYDYINEGRGSIYYDDEKDMYYLRWEDQVIPMENEAFDTETSDPKKYLDVWSATIRLKAKDDFIGGNNILTNGNEAGENLVYSDATIENMDKDDNYKLYGLKKPADGSKIPLREKLQVLSGTDRKINAVDAGGVSQAVYGDGIDIPSSGFPRVVVDVRLQKLNASDLNDVIYMGEVVSPTMMLADLENGYMEGSYYLEYLRRYAYRLYGYDAAKTPLLDLLNQWLKIDKANEFQKTFTIPYIYLPEPIYKNDNTLETEPFDGKNKVIVNNSTGMTTKKDGNYMIADFNDPNLRDVTGFITYTWKRDEDSVEEQQKVEGTGKYDITQEYVVKNTNQIKYNLQLKFTPLQEGDLPADFKFDKIFITDKDGTNADKFFGINDKKEFDSATEWSIDSNRADYLQAMVDEKHTYTPHVAYNETSEKWELKEGTAVTDKDTYDWDKEYKKVVGNAQIEGENLTKYYTQTPENVGFADKYGNQITNQAGAFTGTYSTNDVCSLVANTTYVKDVVNGALALELVVDGKYLGKSNPEIKADKSYTFTATRYYDDPYDPLPYDKTSGKMNADTGEKSATGVKGKKYQLTFKMDAETLPKDPQENQLYTVWATLTQVEVENGSGYVSIKGDENSDNLYTGYTDADALPIGTYVIDTADNSLDDTQFKIGVNDESDEYFQYLKTDTAPASYTYDKFPKEVYEVSKTAPDSTGDGEYLIKNGRTDNSPKNIAESNRTKETATQKLTFNFGTVDKDKEGASTIGAKGIGVKDYLKENPDDPKLEKFDNDYAKDRLGIILLSVDPNSLAISKKVTNVKESDPNLNHEWEFTITFKPEDTDLDAFKTANDADGFNLTWYKFDNDDGNWQLDDSSSLDHAKTIHFEEKGSTYTVVLKLKHDEKVVIKNLPEGTWQVTETDETGTIFYSAHNNMDEFDDYVPSNKTNEDIALNPNSHVDFVNEFPHELPSAGGIGIDRYIFFGTMFTVASVLFLAMQWVNRKKRRAMQE